MIGKIIGFELKSRFTQWMTLLFVLMMLFQGPWYTKGFYDYYGGEGMLVNASGVFYQNLAGGGLLLIIIVATITAPTLYKDIQHRAAGWLYAYPLAEKQFFLGRFLAAFLTNVIIAFVYLLSMGLSPYVGIAEPSLFGPTPWLQMLHGFVILTIPNMFLLTSLCFFALAVFKKPAVAYLLIFVTVISFLVMQTQAESSGFTPVNLIFDAFAYVAVNEKVSSMPVAARNTAFISLSGSLLINRVLWFSVGLIALLIGYFRFSFKGFTGGKKVAAVKPNSEPALGFQPEAAAGELPPVSQSFAPATFLRKCLNLTSLEFKNIVRPTNFRIIASILVLFCVLQNTFWNASVYIGPTEPITSSMTLFRLSNGVFIVLLLIIWSGELFFKERTVNIWQITGALPVPVWVSQLAKLFAMFGVALVFNLIFIFAGILSQLLMGGAAQIDLSLYVTDFLSYHWGWINHCFFISLVFCVAGLTGNRFVTHVLCAGYFFLLIMAFEFGLFEQLRFGFGFTPGIEDYSEMNGYGIFNRGANWYALMWMVLALAMILIGVLSWDRGLARTLGAKFSWRSKQLGSVGKLSIPLLLIGFIGLQSFIFRQVNGTGNFTPSAVEDATAAAYERTYGYLAGRATAVYDSLDLALDLYPEERRAEYIFTTRIRRTAARPLDTLFLSLPDKTTLTALSYAGQMLSPTLDTEHNLAIVQLPIPLDSTAILCITLDRTLIGFTQSDPQAELAFNGAFASLDVYLPVIGYDHTKRLENNRTRQEYDLPRLPSLLPNRADKYGLTTDAYRSDAAYLRGKITLSTPKEQYPLAPGRRFDERTDADRRYTSFSLAAAGPAHLFFGAAAYDVASTKTAGLEISIYHKPDHAFNIGLYQANIELATDYVREVFGSYPYTSVRLYEIPFYHDPTYAFPNGIAISEKEGWIAKTDGLKEQAYLLHTVASATFEHWLMANVSIANVQGADMLRVALPEALSLQLVERELGAEAVALLKEEKEKIYNKERHSDTNGEPSLLLADGKDYLESNRGALMLFEWSRELGVIPFNREVTALQASDNAAFGSLYDRLLVLTPADRRIHWQRVFTEVSSDQ